MRLWSKIAERGRAVEHLRPRSVTQPRQRVGDPGRTGRPSISAPRRESSEPPAHGCSSTSMTRRPAADAARAAASPAGPAPITSTSQWSLRCSSQRLVRPSTPHFAESRDVADLGLEQVPVRLHEGLVVEAAGQEALQQSRPPRRSMRGPGQQLTLLATRPSASGSSVALALGSCRPLRRHVEDRVRLLRAGAEDAARAVILEAAADDARCRWPAAPRPGCRRHSPRARGRRR